MAHCCCLYVRYIVTLVGSDGQGRAGGIALERRAKRVEPLKRRMSEVLWLQKKS